MAETFLGIFDRYFYWRMSNPSNDSIHFLMENLIHVTKSSFDETSQYFETNSYIRTNKGIDEFISLLPFIIEFKSNSLHLVINIFAAYYNSFNDIKIQYRIKNQLFFKLFHIPSRNESILNIQGNISSATNNSIVSVSRYFVRAYFLRGLFDSSVYTIYEMVNNIHKFWEIAHSASTKSSLYKHIDQTSLVSLLVWFAPELDQINNTFYNDLCEIAKKMMCSRKLPKTFLPLITKIDFYRNEGNWARIQERISKKELGNPMIKILKSDDVKGLQLFFTKSKKQAKDVLLHLPILDISHNPYWILHYSSTLLHIAAFFGSNKCFDYILNTYHDNIDIMEQNEIGLDVFDFAGAGNSKEIIINLKNRNYNVSKSIRMAFLFHHNELAHFLCNEYHISPQSFLPEIIASNNTSALSSNVFKDLPEYQFSAEQLFEISAYYGSFLFIEPNSDYISKTNIEKMLLIATEHGHAEFVKKILEYVQNKKLSIPNEFDINVRNNQNKTSLQIAVEMGNFSITESFIKSKELFNYDYKIDFNVKFEETGQSLLHTCVLMNYIDIAKLLLDSPHYDVNLTDNEHATALHYATRNVKTRGTYYVVDLSTVKDDFQITAEKYISNYSKLINLEMFTLFAMEKQVNFNVFDDYGLAPLHYIAKSGRADYLVVLRKYRVEFKYIGKGEPVEPPDIAFVSQVSVKLAAFNKKLAESKNILNTANSGKESPNDPTTVSDPKSEEQAYQKESSDNNESQSSPNNDDSQSSPNNDDSQSSPNNDAKLGESTRFLLNKYRFPDWEMHSDVDFRIRSRSDNKTPLLFSVENNRPQNCVFLISLVPDSVKDIDFNGRNIFHIGCSCGYDFVLRCISKLDEEELYNLPDKWDCTPLQISAAKGRSACLRLLLLLDNIDTAHQNSKGSTAMQLAQSRSHFFTLQVFEFYNHNK